MIIRKPERADIPALLEIYNYEVENGKATLDITKRTLVQWEQWYDDHNKDNHPLIVCVDKGEIAGYATLSSYRLKEAYRSTVELSVYVSPFHRNKGVGTALMEEIIRLAREDETIHTIVSVITGGNDISCRLHEKFGFTFSGAIKEAGIKFGEYVDILNYFLIVEIADAQL